MTTPFWLLGFGLLYVLVFGGLSLLRREGLSLRFAVEAVVITLLFTGAAALFAVPIHPMLFLLVLYLVTMRVRILVDAGNLLARRGSHQAAAGVYRWALRLFPDDTGRLLVHTNQGVLALQQDRVDEAIGLLAGVVAEADKGYVGLKNLCGCYYNLGVAYRKKGQDAQAALQFSKVLETWPASEYARRAAAALERRRSAHAERGAAAPQEQEEQAE